MDTSTIILALASAGTLAGGLTTLITTLRGLRAAVAPVRSRGKLRWALLADRGRSLRRLRRAGGRRLARPDQDRSPHRCGCAGARRRRSRRALRPIPGGARLAPPVDHGGRGRGLRPDLHRAQAGALPHGSGAPVAVRLVDHLEHRGWATNIPGPDDTWHAHAWPPLLRDGEVSLPELRRAAELEERGLLGPLEPDGEGGYAARILAVAEGGA